MRLVRAGVDALAVSVAVVLTLLWAQRADIEVTRALYAFPPVTVVLFYLRGLYRPRMRLVALEELPAVVGTLSIAAMCVLALALAAGTSANPGSSAVRAWLLAVLLVPAGRAVLASAQRRRRAAGAGGAPALIVGAGLVGGHVARRLLSQPEYGLRPVGFLDADPPGHASGPGRPIPLLGTPDDLETIAGQVGATTVVVAFTAQSDRESVPIVRCCHALGLDILVVPRLFDAYNQRTTLEHLGGLPLLSLRRADPKGWEFAVKHALDRALAAILLLLLSPLLALLAAAVKLTSPGDVLFRQLRVGRDCQPFQLLKFRSMRAPETHAGAFRPDSGSAPGGVEGDDRRTPIGRLLRRTSLDELPQLFNVLRGDMSLVGPRPERPEYVELFESEIDRYGERHRVKAGITGWAQVHGLRGQTSIADRAEWDNHYIENWSLRLDLMILALTVRAIFAPQER
jgi:exopolysaccharide biosynthesis polyprenyl glycosylphosphotransferase